MAIRSGRILADAAQFVIDRIQSAGPGDLNIPQEKIYELGNWTSIASVSDVPEIRWRILEPTYGDRGFFAETYEYPNPQED